MQSTEKGHKLSIFVLLNNNNMDYLGEINKIESANGLDYTSYSLITLDRLICLYQSLPYTNTDERLRVRSKLESLQGIKAFLYGVINVELVRSNKVSLYIDYAEK